MIKMDKERTACNLDLIWWDDAILKLANRENIHCLTLKKFNYLCICLEWDSCIDRQCLRVFIKRVLLLIREHSTFCLQWNLRISLAQMSVTDRIKKEDFFAYLSSSGLPIGSVLSCLTELVLWQPCLVHNELTIGWPAAMECWPWNACEFWQRQNKHAARDWHFHVF